MSNEFSHAVGAMFLSSIAVIGLSMGVSNWVNSDMEDTEKQELNKMVFEMNAKLDCCKDLYEKYECLKKQIEDIKLKNEKANSNTKPKVRKISRRTGPKRRGDVLTGLGRIH